MEKTLVAIKSESRKIYGVECGPQANIKSQESEAGTTEDLVKVNVSKSVKKIEVQLKKSSIEKKNTSEKKILNCEFCDNTGKTNITLEKHMANNHQNHKGDDDDGCPSEYEIFNLSEIKEQKAEKDKNKEKFLFSQSMLDEFDPWLKKQSMTAD